MLKNIFKKREGFSMMEMVISIGILAALGIIGISGVSQLRSNKALSNETSKIMTLMREMQQRATGQEENVKWGIKFFNGTGEKDYYVVFYGNAYTSEAQRGVYYLDNSLELLNPTVGNTKELVFSKLTGLLTTESYVDIGRVDGGGSYRLVAEKNGKIQRIKNGYGLEGYWKFDEPVGESVAVDSSGNEINGVVSSGVATGQAGKVLRAMDFSGSCTNSVTLSSSNLNFTIQDYTVLMWVKPATNIENARVFSNGSYQVSGYEMFVDTGVDARTYQTGAYQHTGSETSQISPGTWYHVAITRDGSTIKTYINGMDKTSSSGSHINPASSGSTAYIGKYYGSSSSYCFDGLIDEVRVYSRALPEKEINDLYVESR